MSNLFFFTDYDLLNIQSSIDSYGPVAGFETTKYKVTSHHSSDDDTGLPDPRAFAIIDGVIRFQKDSTNSDLLNMVLKPTNPSINGYNIQYFIYRGIRKDSLIDTATSTLLPATENDLTNKLWEVQTAINTHLVSPLDPNPNALGIGFDPSALDINLIRLDTDLVESLFYEGSLYKPLDVKGGEYLGKFDREAFGLEIVLNGIIFKSELSIIRNIDLNDGFIFDLDSLGATPSQIEADAFRENILYFIDPACFFGSFYRDGINIKNSSNTPLVTLASEANLYTKVLSKFYNKNKVYLDIRNENGMSLNYYKNYGPASIKLSCNSDFTTSLSSVDYYTYNWPIKIIAIDDFVSVETKKRTPIRVALPVFDNEKLLIYYSQAYTFNKKLPFPVSPKEESLFFQLSIDPVNTDWTTPFILSAFWHNDETLDIYVPIAGYLKLFYIKQLETSPTSDTTAVVNTNHYLDNLFSVNLIDSYKKWVNLYPAKFWGLSHEKYIEFTPNSNIQYGAVVQTGVGYDDNRITFFARPTAFYQAGKLKPSTKQIVSSTGNINSVLLAMYPSVGSDLFIQKEKFDITPNPADSSYYLNYYKSKGNSYDDDACFVISLTKLEYEEIETALTTSGFISKFHPIFLQVNNTSEVSGDSQNRVCKKIGLKLAGFNISGKSIFVDLPTLPLFYSTDQIIFCTNNAAELEPLALNENYDILIVPANTTTEFAEFYQAMQDIKTHNRRIFDKVIEKVFHGYLNYFPNPSNHQKSLLKLNRYKISLDYGTLAAANPNAAGETSIGAYYPDCVDPNPAIGTRISTLGIPSGFDDDDHLTLLDNAVTNFIDYNLLYSLSPSEIAVQFQPLVVCTLDSRTGLIDIQTLPIVKAAQLGYAAIDPAVPITIVFSNAVRNTIAATPFQPDPRIDPGDNQRRFWLAHSLAHEFGHADFDISNSLLSRIWGQYVEFYFPNTYNTYYADNSSHNFPLFDEDYGNGHIRGNPSGNISCNMGKITFDEYATFHTRKAGSDQNKYGLTGALQRALADMTPDFVDYCGGNLG